MFTFGKVSSLSETHLQGIGVVLLIKTNIQSKTMNTTIMISCRRISYTVLDILINEEFLKDRVVKSVSNVILTGCVEYPVLQMFLEECM